jgi:hypothetical protein
MLEKEARMFGRQGDSKLDRARAGVAAAAHQVTEKTKEVVSGARDTAKEAARIVRESEPDEQLRQKASSGTERGIDRAGEAVTAAAPAIGRGAEYAAGKVGAVLKFAARPIGAIIGPIAGVVGGWWKTARHDATGSLPAEDEQACRAHFTSLALLDGINFDQARNGYVIGYIAGCNPDYSGRAFDEVEADLRHGFQDAEAEYDAIRQFARFGFDRGTSRERIHG